MNIPKVIEKQPDLQALWLRFSDHAVRDFADLRNSLWTYRRNLERHKLTNRARVSKRSQVVWTDEKIFGGSAWRQKGKIGDEYEYDSQEYREHANAFATHLSQLLIQACADWIEGERISNERAGISMDGTYIQQALQRCFQDVQDFIRNPPPTP